MNRTASVVLSLLLIIPAIASAQTSGPPAREQATFAPSRSAADGQLVMLWPAGAANAINQIFPASRGRILVLRSGEEFFLPDSVTVSGGSDLQEGDAIVGQYETVDGRNVLRTASVDLSGGRGGNSGGGA